MPDAFCDLHCHLVYGVDDGAKTLEDSLEMARVLVDLGFDTVAPSPHNRAEYASAKLAVERMQEVQGALDAAGVAVKLHLNSENAFVDPLLLSAQGTPAARTLAGGPCLLVEAPYSSPVPALMEMIFRLKLKGITPLIAHPERCAEFEQKGRAAEAVRAGALLQLDIGALTLRYGPGARKLARTFLDEGLYAVAATDLHGPHGAREWLSKALNELRSRAGEEALTALLATHPRRLLRGEVLEM